MCAISNIWDTALVPLLVYLPHKLNLTNTSFKEISTFDRN